MIKKKRYKWVDKKLKNFLFNFFSKNLQFKYRNQIRFCSFYNKKTFQILNEDLKEFDIDLFVYLVEKPFECINCFEFIINKILRSFFVSNLIQEEKQKTVQIILIPSDNSVAFKNIMAKNLEKLVNLEVKVVSVSSTKFRISNLWLKGSQNEQMKFLFLNNKIDQSVNSKEKKIIENKYPNKSAFYKPVFIDFQIVKVVDFLEIKKFDHINDFLLLLVEREMVGKLVPGKVLKITGVYTLNNFSTKKNDSRILKKTLIHVLGFQNYEDNLTIKLFKKDLVFDLDFLDLIETKNIYNWIVSTICPDILGQNMIKAGLAVLLFGGNYIDSRKKSLVGSPVNMMIIGNNESLQNSLFYFIKKMKNHGSTTLNHKNFNYDEEINSNKSPSIDNNLDLLNIEENSQKKILYLKDMEKKSESELIKVFDLFYKNEQIYNQNNYQKKTTTKVSVLAGISEKFMKKISLLSAETGVLNLYNLSNFDLIFPVKNSNNNFTGRKDVRYYFESKKNKQKITLPFYELNRISSKMLEKYLNFTKNKPSPFLCKEASIILRNAYLFMRINIKKNLSKNQGKYFYVGIKQLESLIKISESLGKMKISNFISVDEVFEAVRLFQKRFFI